MNTQTPRRDAPQDAVRMAPMDHDSHNNNNSKGNNRSGAYLSSNDLTLSRRRQRQIVPPPPGRNDESSLPHDLNRLSFANKKKGPSKHSTHADDQDAFSVAQETVTTAASTLDGTLASSVFSSGTRNTDTTRIVDTSPLIRRIPSHVDSVPHSYRADDVPADRMPSSLGTNWISPPSIYFSPPTSTVTSTERQQDNEAAYSSRFRVEDMDYDSTPAASMPSRATRPFRTNDRPQVPEPRYYSPFAEEETFYDSKPVSSMVSRGTSLTPGRESEYSPNVLSFGQFCADAIQTFIPDCQFVLLEAESLPTLEEVYQMAESPTQCLTPDRIEQIQLVILRIYKYQVRQLLETSRHGQPSTLPYLCTTTQWSTAWEFIHPNDTEKVTMALPRLLLMRTDVSCIQDLAERLCNTGTYPSPEMWMSGILFIVRHMCQIQGFPMIEYKYENSP